jgi:hypothetical protein
VDLVHGVFGLMLIDICGWIKGESVSSVLEIVAGALCVGVAFVFVQAALSTISALEADAALSHNSFGNGDKRCPSCVIDGEESNCVQAKLGKILRRLNPQPSFPLFGCWRWSDG